MIVAEPVAGPAAAGSSCFQLQAVVNKALHRQHGCMSAAVLLHAGPSTPVKSAQTHQGQQHERAPAQLLLSHG